MKTTTDSTNFILQMKKFIYVTFSLFCLTNFLSCASTNVNYSPPRDAKETTTATLKDPFEAAWTKSVRALGGSFFVMNNIVKDSKIINLSYSGDPEKYVDCGLISVNVSESTGTSTYQFPGARKSVQFKFAKGFRSSVVNRQMSLEGRINILFEELNKNETGVKVVVRYVVTRTGTETVTDHLNNRSATLPLSPLSFNFNTGGSDSATGESTSTCRPTGEMEKTLLELLTSAYRQ